MNGREQPTFAAVSLYVHTHIKLKYAKNQTFVLAGLEDLIGLLPRLVLDKPSSEVLILVKAPIHLMAIYLRNVDGVINCYVMDSKALHLQFQLTSLFMQHLQQAFPDIVIYLNGTAIQVRGDLVNADSYSIYALEYFAENGEIVFKQLAEMQVGAMQDCNAKLLVEGAIPDKLHDVTTDDNFEERSIELDAQINELHDVYRDRNISWLENAIENICLEMQGQLVAPISQLKRSCEVQCQLFTAIKTIIDAVEGLSTVRKTWLELSLIVQQQLTEQNNNLRVESINAIDFNIFKHLLGNQALDQITKDILHLLSNIIELDLYAYFTKDHLKKIIVSINAKYLLLEESILLDVKNYIGNEVHLETMVENKQVGRAQVQRMLYDLLQGASFENIDGYLTSFLLPKLKSQDDVVVRYMLEVVALSECLERLLNWQQDVLTQVNVQHASAPLLSRFKEKLAAHEHAHSLRFLAYKEQLSRYTSNQGFLEMVTIESFETIEKCLDGEPIELIGSWLDRGDKNQQEKALTKFKECYGIFCAELQLEDNFNRERFGNTNSLIISLLSLNENDKSIADHFLKKFEDNKWIFKLVFRDLKKMIPHIDSKDFFQAAPPDFLKKLFCNRKLYSMLLAGEDKYQNFISFAKDIFLSLDFESHQDVFYLLGGNKYCSLFPSTKKILPLLSRFDFTAQCKIGSWILSHTCVDRETVEALPLELVSYIKACAQLSEIPVLSDSVKEVVLTDIQINNNDILAACREITELISTFDFATRSYLRSAYHALRRVSKYYLHEMSDFREKYPNSEDEPYSVRCEYEQIKDKLALIMEATSACARVNDFFRAQLIIYLSTCSWGMLEDVDHYDPEKAVGLNNVQSEYRRIKRYIHEMKSSHDYFRESLIEKTKKLQASIPVSKKRPAEMLDTESIKLPRLDSPSSPSMFAPKSPSFLPESSLVSLPDIDDAEIRDLMGSYFNCTN